MLLSYCKKLLALIVIGSVSIAIAMDNPHKPVAATESYDTAAMNTTVINALKKFAQDYQKANFPALTSNEKVGQLAISVNDDLDDIVENIIMPFWLKQGLVTKKIYDNKVSFFKNKKPVSAEVIAAGNQYFVPTIGNIIEFFEKYFAQKQALKTSIQQANQWDSIREEETRNLIVKGYILPSQEGRDYDFKDWMKEIANSESPGSDTELPIVTNIAGYVGNIIGLSNDIKSLLQSKEGPIMTHFTIRRGDEVLRQISGQMPQFNQFNIKQFWQDLYDKNLEMRRKQRKELEKRRKELNVAYPGLIEKVGPDIAAKLGSYVLGSEQEAQEFRGDYSSLQNELLALHTIWSPENARITSNQLTQLADRIADLYKILSGRRGKELPSPFVKAYVTYVNKLEDVCTRRLKEQQKKKSWAKADIIRAQRWAIAAHTCIRTILETADLIGLIDQNAFKELSRNLEYFLLKLNGLKE